MLQDSQPATLATSSRHIYNTSRNTHLGKAPSHGRVQGMGAVGSSPAPTAEPQKTAHHLGQTPGLHSPSALTLALPGRCRTGRQPAATHITLDCFGCEHQRTMWHMHICLVFACRCSISSHSRLCEKIEQVQANARHICMFFILADTKKRDDLLKDHSRKGHVCTQALSRHARRGTDLMGEDDKGLIQPSSASLCLLPGHGKAYLG